MSTIVKLNWNYCAGIGCCILASFIGFYFPNKSFVADIKVDAQSSAAKIPSIKQITKTTDATKPSSQIPNRIVSTTSSKKTITTTSLKTTPTNSPKVPRKPATVGKATKAMDTSKHAANAPKVAAKPIPKADAAFSASDEKTKDTSGHTASPSQSSTRKGCYAEIDLKEAMEGKESMAVLQFTSTDSQSCDLSNDSLACELVSEITGTKVTCKVNFIENGKYELTYLPTVKGRHKFHVSVDNQHIGGSPYGVTVLKSPNKALGDPLLTIAGVDRPRGVAIAKNGEIIVTEEGRNRVSIFSPGGQKLRSFGTYGSGNGKFSSLRGVAVDKAGEILVVDKFNFHIQKFTMNGEFIRAVGTDGMGFIISEQFFLSSDVESKNTKVYVLDKLNNIVQTLDTDLISLHPIGKKGKSDLRQYTHPLGISHATTGEIYVTSFDYHEVLVFAPDGKFLNRFGRDKSYPGLKGVMDWPNGIAVGNDGVVYVSENKSNRVKMYSLKGQLLGSFGTYGEDPGEFDHPRGLAVDSAGVLYVCDSGNNRIQVF